MVAEAIDRPLAALFLGLASVLLASPHLHAAPPAGLLVEVRGTVGIPGWHRVDPPTLWAALEAAHADADDVTDQALQLGDAVVVGPTGPTVTRVGQPLLLGRPLSVLDDPAEAFADLPGVGDDDVARLGRPGSDARRTPPGRIARWSERAPRAVVAAPPRSSTSTSTPPKPSKRCRASARRSPRASSRTAKPTVPSARWPISTPSLGSDRQLWHASHRWRP